jgi:hypothetical protein
LPATSAISKKFGFSLRSNTSNFSVFSDDSPCGGRNQFLAYFQYSTPRGNIPAQASNSTPATLQRSPTKTPEIFFPNATFFNRFGHFWPGARKISFALVKRWLGAGS